MISAGSALTCFALAWFHLWSVNELRFSSSLGSSWECSQQGLGCSLAQGDKADGDEQQRQGLSRGCFKRLRATDSSLGWKRAEPRGAGAESRMDYPCSIPMLPLVPHCVQEGKILNSAKFNHDNESCTAAALHTRGIWGTQLSPPAPGTCRSTGTPGPGAGTPGLGAQGHQVLEQGHDNGTGTRAPGTGTPGPG